MADITAEQVATVVHTMMQDPDPSKKEGADKWLKEFQKSKQAWEISDQLLHRNLSLEVSHFAAQTMKTKILCFFHELPTASYESLRSSLFQHLCNFSRVHSVMIQLCVAIADFIIYLTTWKNALLDVMSALSSPEHRAALVSLLTELPEEVNNSRVNVSSERRSQVAFELGINSGGVYPFLMTCWGQSTGDTRTRLFILNCFRSWLKFGGQGSIGIEKMGIPDALFEALTVAELQQDAGPAIEACLILSSDRKHHLALRECIVPMVFTKLVDPFRVTIAESDEDLGRILANIFVAMTETEADRLVTDPEANMNMLELMLLCAQHPEPLVARTTFSFWYNLSDALDATRLERLRFESYFSAFILHLVRLVQCPTAQPALLSSKEELYDFRLDARDLISDTSGVIGNSKCVHLLTECLLGQQTWQGAEATLFMLSSVVGRVGGDNADVGRVLSHIASFPSSSHVALRNTCLTIIGLVSDWICNHEESIAPLFRMVYESMPNKLLVRNAAYALKCLLSSGREKMASLLPAVYSVFQQDYTNFFRPDDVSELIKGAARVVSALSPPSRIAEEAAHLCEPFFQELTVILQGQSTEHPQQSLDNLAVFFRNANVPSNLLSAADGHPLFPVAQRTWALVDALLLAFEKSESVVEKCNSCLKWMVRSLDTFSAPFLEAIANKAMIMYQKWRYSSFLYVSSILIEVFARNTDNLPFMYTLLHAFVQTALDMLGLPADAVNADPKLVEDFFRLVSRAVFVQPMLMLQDQPMSYAVFQFACEAILITNREANEIVVQFLLDFASAGHRFSSNPSVRAAVLPVLDVHGQRLVHNLMNGLTGGLPAFMSRDVSAVMWELLRLSREHVVAWATSAPCLKPEALDSRLSMSDVRRLLEILNS